MNDLLMGMVKDQLSKKFYEKVGSSMGMDTKKTEGLAKKALPFILGSMAKEAGTKKGAEGLFKAMTNPKHDGSILDKTDDLIAAPEKGEGAGILKHLLGDKEKTAEKFLEKKTKAPKENGQKMLQILAPMIMGALGKTQKKGNFSISQMMGMVKMLSGDKKLGGGGMAKSMVINFLDKDGDGDIKDDLFNMGKAWVMNKMKKRV